MHSMLFILSTLSSKCDKKAVRWFIIVIVFSFLSAFLMALLPLTLSHLTGLIESKDNVHYEAILLGFVYVSIISAQKLIGFISLYLQSSIRIESIKALSQIYFTALFTNNESISADENTGYVTQKLNQASNELYTLIRNLTMSLLSPFLQVFFSLFIIFRTGDFFVGSAFILYTASFISVSQFYNKRLLKFRQNLMDAGVKTYSKLTDCVKNMPAVRACNSFTFFFQRFENSLNEDAVSQYDYWRLNFIYLLSCSFVNILFFGGALIYTIISVIDGSVSFPHFILVTSYIIALSSPLENLSEMLTEIRHSVNVLYKFLAESCKEVVGSDSTLMPSSNEVTLKNINFYYPDSNVKVLDDVSISINSGEFFTITGKSGSGKSTLVKIISGLLTPNSGYVIFGNSKASSISQFALNDFCYFVTQNERVFMDSVRFNLQIANPNASDEELLLALSMANFPNDSPLSDNSILDILLGDEGMTLSGGQRQRLSLARLFLRKPSVIILDEITSSLDVINEFEVIKNIRSFFKSATIINISHRVSTFQHSQRVCVLDAGTVVDVGTLESLKGTSEYISHILCESPIPSRNATKW